MKTMRWVAATTICVALGLGACGDSGTDEDTSATDATDSGGDTTVATSDATGTTEAETSDATTPPDVAATKAFGERCGSNAECQSSYCVPTAIGNACTRPCGAQCPEGWSCGRVVNAGSDGVEVCLDRQTTLCHPCDSAADCNIFGGPQDNACLDFGERGSFCGITCDGSSPCPTGYQCTDADGVLTTGDGQCRPSDGGECSCNELGVILESDTTCSASNAVGTCLGRRACGDDGLSACGAPVPKVEECNNVDDDCNGKTDDALTVGSDCLVTNQFGACPGRAFCVAGEEQCVGLEAQPEVCDAQDQDCDGETDEGFANLDGDATPDCLDEDDDGDGVDDGEDCAPKDATRYQGATEVCNGEDDDCNGAKDDEGAQGCSVFFQDVDRDGYGSLAAPSRCLCAADTTTFYDKATQSDCNDIDDQVFPGAAEICNSLDDSCEGATDEGVQAPCGGCTNACLLEAGAGTADVFAAGQATNLVVNGSGHLVLAAGQTSGTYRQIWTGWPLDETEWRIIFVDVTYPPGPNGGGTAITLRWRTAANEAALGGAAFSAPITFPPEYLPAWPDVVGDVIEVELGLTTTSVGTSPTVKELSVLGATAD